MIPTPPRHTLGPMSDHHIAIRRAVLSVSDKTDLIPFARGLVEFGIEIISTGGTARKLDEAGIAVTPIDQITGFPEMMGGRVKTLHPNVHGALLARRDDQSHLDALATHGISPIDLLCVNLYPFEQTVRQPDIAEDQAIEQIDIGGPSMLRSAAKNHQFVTVVTNPSQYDRVINELRAHEGHTTLTLRRDLAAAAFTRTAEYDTAIASWMCSRQSGDFPQTLRLTYAHVSELRYGENPHQHAALYSNPSSGDPTITRANILHGKPLSYNNILDASAVVEFTRDLAASFRDQHCAAIVKHTNPCGGAVADSPVDAVNRACAGDPLAAFGGIAAINTEVDDALAHAICQGKKFLEVIIAPSFSDSAIATLGERWANVRLLALGSFDRSDRRKVDYRSVPGGMLVQDRDLKLPEPHEWGHAAGPDPTDAMLADAAFAILACKHLKSNAISIAADGQLLGIGSGQVDRVTACRLATEKAAARIGEFAAPVAGSDAFFPFNDGPQHLIDAGVTCIVHPGGSKRDADTLKLCDKHGVTCLITRTRHFKH